ncbi:MAG: ribonuclease D [Candidatus Geothermincolia bacterium]
MKRAKYITDVGDLGELEESLAAAPRLAVDLEADSFHHYGDRLCLLQISTGKRIFLVDVLELGEASLMVAPFLADASKEKVFHDADYDGRMLLRSLGVRPSNVFDTMIAARILGKPNVGLASLLDEYFGVKLEKQYQRADWSHRPLGPEMIDYAALDTAYLLQLRDRLERELKQQKRLEWAREEFELLMESLEPIPERAPSFRRVKGAGHLTQRELAVLQALLEWRETLARRKDVPPFKVIGNERLLKLAQDKPRNSRAIDSNQSLTPKQQRLYGKGIVEAVQHGMQLPEEDLPTWPATVRQRPDHKAERLIVRLKSWRDQKAADLEMDPGVLLPNALLGHLARSRPATREALEESGFLKKWQRELLGDEILELMKPPRR